MKIKHWPILVLVLVSAAPFAVSAKDKKSTERGMLEKMEAVPCGAKSRGLTGVGSLWASAGITHLNSDEKLCPQYLLRTDEMEYEIRPTDEKHPVVLPVGQEGEFHIKKDRMFLTVAEGPGDHKTRTYEVVTMKPTNTGDEEDKSSTASTTSSKQP